MWNVKCVVRKSGVSLITVLLFMLVATIAATATYKWITSEGRSSGSRMLEREAYQSSVAGLENARTWMTYHANDVGDLIHQFIAGGNKPINLDGRLRTLQRAGQNYHVWMTGVNTDNPTYKVKLVSYGEARGNTRHAEAAIFNVDGLYRVEVPSKKFSGDLNFEEAFFGTLTGGQTFDVQSGVFNGNMVVNTSVKSTGHVLVTGNLEVNSSSEFNDLYVKGHVCACTKFWVKGNARFEQTLYVGGGSIGNETTPTGGMKVDRDLYLDNGVDLTTKTVCSYQHCGTGDLYVDGNVSSYGDVVMLNTSSGQKATQIDGNLVVNNGKQIIFPTKSNKASGPWMKKGDGYSFKVLGNVFVDNGFNEGMHGFYYAAPDVAFGSTGKTVYIPGQYRISTANGAVDQTYSFWYDDLGKDVSFGYGSCNYHRLYLKSNDLYYNCYKGTSAGQNYTDVSWPLQETKLGPLAANTFCNRDKCSPTGGNGDGKYYGPFTYPYFQGEGYIRNDIFTQINGSYTNSKPTDTIGWGADPLTKYQNMVTTETEGNCTGAHVSDPIQFNKKLFDKNTVGNKLHNEENPGACDIDGLWGKDNSIDRWHLLEECYDRAESAKELYDGKWLIIEFDSDVTFATLNGNTPSELTNKYIIKFDNAYGGYGQSGLKLISTNSDAMAILYFPNGGSIETHIGAGNSANYFIYGENTVNYNNGSDVITGSIFMSNCSAFNVSGNNAVNAVYNGDLTEALRSSGVICNYAGTDVCSAGSSGSGGTGSGSGTTGTTSGGLDAYYISMAPQLGVTLESQTETSETFSEASGNVTALSPAFIVLPRVIYLPSDPYGKLSDYYSILPLNGSTLEKSDVTIGTWPATTSSCSDLTGSTIVSDGETLTKNTIYQCKASATGHADVPFWVVIGDSQRGKPAVNFVESSQEAPVTTSSPMQVHAYIPAHATSFTLSVSCPNLGECGTNYCQGSGWRYDLQSGGTRNSETGLCTFNIGASNEAQEAYPLFNITTSGASNGTVTFHLQAGEGYQRTSPYSSELHISSTATIYREDASSEELAALCENNNDCPSDLNAWPSVNCTEAKLGTWVDITGASGGPIDPNDSWSIAVGGTGTVSLTSAYSGDECLVLIPPDERSLAGVKPNFPITPPLHASLKPKRKEFKVGFTGDVGDGKKPVIVVNIGESINSSGEGSRIKDAKCKHENFTGSDPKYCSYDVFPGEKVTFKVDDGSGSRDFNYWKCASDNCPNMESLNNKNYTTTPITISMDYTYTYLAHFGESDKHCFFEEFKNGTGDDHSRTNRTTLECSSGVEYCIDDCGGSGCSSAENASGYKWRLMGHSLDDIEYSALYGYLSAKKNMNKGKKESERQGIVVMSSVNAGLDGTLKALMQLPSAISQGTDSRNIRGSGFILHSDKQASEYLLLNLYVNSSGKLEAQLCKKDGSGIGSCTRAELVMAGGSSSASVGPSNMIMVNATFSGSSLTVSAITSKGGYYGNSPTEYRHTFDVSSVDFNDRAHEFVGFTLADPAFKIHGIGWHSDDYNADCFDYYPTVKCSFAAVADGGIVETETTSPVKPWVGYSGWFTSSGACTEKFYYYNGNDACNNPGEGEKNECVGGYTFASGVGKEGPHGYRQGSVDVKTAKAWLECPTTSDATAGWTLNADWWTSAAAESEYAHCGYFWTGKYQGCAKDQADLLGTSATPTTVSSNALASIALNGVNGAPVNLRDSRLNITLEDNSGSVEIWLESDNTGSGCWGGCDAFQSASAIVKGNSANLDVVSSFPGDSMGFNPEKVSRIVVKNHGDQAIKVKAISSACDNAIGITSCSAEYNDVAGRWNITMNVTNRGKIEHRSYKVDVTANGSTESKLSYTEGNCQNGATDGTITCSYESNPYNGDQGKQYGFTAKITGNQGRSEATKTCTVTPETIRSISCGTPTANDVPYGGNWPQFSFTMTGCPGGSCPYDIYLGSGEGSSAGSLLGDECGEGTEPCSGTANNGVAVKKTKSGKPLECTDAAGCKYTYTVKSPEGSAKPFSDCSASFKVMPKGAITADCEFSPATVAKGGTATLQMTNIQNVDKSTNISVTCTNCPSGYTIAPSVTSLSSNTPQNITFPAPNSASSGYTYSVKYTPAGGTAREICSSAPTLTVVDGLSCTITSSITLGEYVTFKPSWGGDCESTTLTGNGVEANPTPCASSYTFTPTEVGTLTYAYKFTGDIGTDVECPTTPTVTVNPRAPTFDCSADPVTIGSGNPSINLTNIQWCDNNCTVVLNKGNSTLSESGSTSGNNDYTINFTDNVTEAGTVDYTVTLSWANDKTKTETCSVRYDEPPSGCTVVTQGISGDNVNINDYLSSGCADITLDKVCLGQLNVEVTSCKGKSVTWNGASFTLDDDPGKTKGEYYAEYNPSPNFTYHLEVSDCSDKAFHVYMSSCNALPTASKVPEIKGCPTATITRLPNTSVNTSITIDNCQVVDGCTYTITKNLVSGPAITYYRGTLPPISGEASGTYTYVISARNSKGSVPTNGLCSFDVVYSSDAPTTIENYVSGRALTSGKYLIEKCNGEDGDRDTQISANFTYCFNAFYGESGDGGYWNNQSNNCNGQRTINYPVTVTVPSGGSLTITNCYN